MNHSSTNNTLTEQDKAARMQALDATQSFIVQAPAGSGKTELLIQRFLTLLQYVNKPEEVLAITFTKKAANEMRARIIKAFNQTREPEPVSIHAKETRQLANRVLARSEQLQWHLLQNPNQLRIQTIDSLCTYLTNQLPILSHFGSQPDIADDPKQLYSEAVQEVLSHVEEHVEWAVAISQLLLHIDNDVDKLHDLLVHLLQKRDQWVPFLHLHDEAMRCELEAHLTAIIEKQLAEALALFPRELLVELIPIARFAADQLALDNPTSPILACRDLQTIPDISVDDKPIWLGLIELLMTKENTWRKSVDKRIGLPTSKEAKAHKEKLIGLLTSLPVLTDERLGLQDAATSAMDGAFGARSQYRQANDIDALLRALTNIRHLPDATYQDAQWQILQSLLFVLKITIAQLRITFQQHGQIDFIENAQAALTALGEENNPTDLALVLDYQIKHLLIDEFQDTASTQYQLVEKLTAGWDRQDGRTLFVVGDPMQSIYRFREAEVGLFIRMCQNGLGHIKLTPLTLSVNFRSTSNVVEWNNAHFQAIFPEQNDIGTGAVSYSHSISNQASSNTDTNISIKGCLNTQMEADHIIQCIQETQSHYPDESIAILVRARTDLNAIIPALKKANIPYHAVDIDSLASRPIIRDLMALTRALLHPADRIAWLSILRAPWCGLTLADLLCIAGHDKDAAIDEQLDNEEVIRTLSHDGQIRIARFFPIIKNKIAERERMDLRTWIESTWVMIGGPACLENEADREDANAYFKLLENIDEKHAIINIDMLKEKVKNLYASHQNTTAPLQIMTIHAAKGLEFDTVILARLDRAPSHHNQPLLSWMEQPLKNGKTALLLSTLHGTDEDKNAIYEYIRKQQKTKSQYETDRLLYVAATRAKKRLHLCFSIKQNEKGEIQVKQDSFLAKLWSFIEPQKDEFIDSSSTSNVQEKQASRYIKRLPNIWQNPIQENRLTTSASHQQQSGFQLENVTAKYIGTIAHKVLQLIAEHGISWWTNNATQQANYLRHQLAQIGMPPDQMDNARETLQTIIQNTLNDERGRWILHTHNDAKSEWAITAMINDEPKQLVIDRTFIDEQGSRWIIDYKTTTFSHDDLNAFLDKEQEKYREKMEIYHHAIQLIDNRPIKMGLYFPALPAWREI